MEKSSKEKNRYNYSRVDRIEEIMRDLGYERGSKRKDVKSQKDFARDIGMEPQNFSRDMASGKISENFCKKIVEAFPEYRLDWIMGYGDCKTWDDYCDRRSNENNDILYGIWGAFERSLNTRDKTIRFNHSPGQNIRLTERRSYPGCYYSIQDLEGNEIKQLSVDDMISLEKKVLEYCDLLALKYL